MGNANKKGLVKSKNQGESGSQKGVSRASSKAVNTPAGPGSELSGDICTECEQDFGFSGEDGNGFNSSCVHCGNNTYWSTDDE